MNTTDIRSRILDLIETGVLSKDEVIMELIQATSTYDLEDIANQADWISDEEEEEEEEE